MIIKTEKKGTAKLTKNLQRKNLYGSNFTASISLILLFIQT